MRAGPWPLLDGDRGELGSLLKFGGPFFSVAVTEYILLWADSSSLSSAADAERPSLLIETAFMTGHADLSARLARLRTSLRTDLPESCCKPFVSAAWSGEDSSTPEAMNPFHETHTR